ncbi:MAG: hypothetical protein ACOYNL_03980 [Rickettsiales bacterium]
MRWLTPLLVLALLSACANTADGMRASIRGWCENNPDYCNIAAVK